MRDETFRFGGEFRDPGRERAFQGDRLPEILRQCRLLFLLSAGLNALFLLSDWRFHGTPHFLVAVPARLLVVAASLACALMIRHVSTFHWAEKLVIFWKIAAAAGVAFLVSSRSDLALFVVLFLPSIFYLVAPASFRVTVVSGIGCSIAMLAGYLGAEPYPETTLGLVLVLVMLNAALSLVVIHANRLRRLEWLATQSERAANEALSESRALVERIFMAVPIPLVVADVTDGRFLRANDAALRYLGAPGSSDLSDRSFVDYVSRDARRAFMRQLGTDGRVAAFETQIHDSSGHERETVVTAASLAIEQKQAIVVGIVDITERKLAEQRTRWQAGHDTLTGLPNRLLFQERLDRALAEPERVTTLLLLDLDDFKSVNDTLGHDAGDALLVEAASRIAEEIGPEDLVSRLGGDEFVVLSRAAETPEEAQVIAERLLSVLRAPFHWGTHAISPRASIGFALSPFHHDDPAELFKDADLALYRAKALGRNTAVVYGRELREVMDTRVAICRDLTEAVSQQRILPFYQPQIDLTTGAVEGFEVLARWKHPERGIVPASGFALGLEDPETAGLISDAVLSGALADLSGWLRDGVPVSCLWLNLAPCAFRDPNLGKSLLRRLSEAGIPESCFGVEVTETVLLMRNGSAAERTLHELRERGIRVALDDFGTGYASLSHLKRLPVDVIKLDRSFVGQVGESVGDTAIVRAITALAGDLGLDIVAEGVETEEQEAFLRRIGCRFGQGYRFARPAPASRVPWLASRESLLPAGNAPRAEGGGVAAA